MMDTSLSQAFEKALSLGRAAVVLAITAVLVFTAANQAHAQVWQSRARSNVAAGYHPQVPYACFQRPVVVYYGRGYGYYVQNQLVCVSTVPPPRGVYGAPAYRTPSEYSTRSPNAWRPPAQQTVYAPSPYPQVPSAPPLQQPSAQTNAIAYGAQNYQGAQSASEQTSTQPVVYGRSGQAISTPYKVDQATSRQSVSPALMSPEAQKSRPDLTVQQAIVGLNNVATIADAADKLSDFLDDFLELLAQVLGM